MDVKQKKSSDPKDMQAISDPTAITQTELENLAAEAIKKFKKM